MDKRIKNYIFDLDGTIINSCQEVLKCFEKAFAIVGYPINKSNLTSNLIGPPLAQIVQNIAPELKDEAVLNEVTDNFRMIYDNDTNDKSVLYEGIYDKLCELKQEGKKLFLATLKPTKPTNRILQSYKLDMFDDVYTIDKFNTLITKKDMLEDILNKYKLNPSETVMIGDALTDVEAANVTGIISIGALWGYGSDKTDLINHSKYLINSIKEIDSLEISV